MSELKFYTATCHVRWVCTVKAPSRQAAETFILKKSRESDFLKLDEPDDWDEPLIEELRRLDDYIELDDGGRVVRRVET